jgi:hypothetical protein
MKQSRLLDYALIADEGLTKHAMQSVSDWADANPWKSLAVASTPGLGTAFSLNNAASDFRRGRVWSGIGNVGMAGLSLVGLGGAGRLGKMGLSALGKSVGRMPGVKALSSKAPTLTKGMQAMGSGAMKGLQTMGHGLEKSRSLMAGGAMKGLGKLPGGSKLVGSMQANPGRYTLGGTMGTMGAFALQGKQDRQQQMSHQQGFQIADFMNRFRDQPGFNPIWARPS